MSFAYNQQHGFGPPPLSPIGDPGDTGDIPVEKSGTIALTSGAGLETRALALPTFEDQEIALYAEVIGGNIDVTVTGGLSVTGLTVIGFTTANESIHLRAVNTGSGLVWRVVWNDMLGAMAAVAMGAVAISVAAVPTMATLSPADLAYIRGVATTARVISMLAGGMAVVNTMVVTSVGGPDLRAGLI